SRRVAGTLSARSPMTTPAPVAAPMHRRRHRRLSPHLCIGVGIGACRRTYASASASAVAAAHQAVIRAAGVLAPDYGKAGDLCRRSSTSRRRFVVETPGGALGIAVIVAPGALIFAIVYWIVEKFFPTWYLALRGVGTAGLTIAGLSSARTAVAESE